MSQNNYETFCLSSSSNHKKITTSIEVEEILFRTNLDACAEKEQRGDMVKVLMSIKRIIDNAHKSFRD